MTPTQKDILERRSIRKYKKVPVPADLIQAVVDAGLWAPTARNEQEIRIVCVQDPILRQAFRDDFTAAGGRTIRPLPFDYESPVFFFLYGPKDFPYTEMDTGIVAENMCLAAQSLGLSTVMIGCIRDFMRSPAAEPWRQRLGIGDGMVFTLGLCLGYADGEAKAPDRKPDRYKTLG